MLLPLRVDEHFPFNNKIITQQKNGISEKTAVKKASDHSGRLTSTD